MIIKCFFCLYFSIKFQVLLSQAEAEELTDLDKLYIALTEVGRRNLFDLLCYSFNITSLDDLQKYTAEDSTSAYISDEIKSFLEGKDFNFKELVQVT